jgi:hypothetical protein
MNVVMREIADFIVFLEGLKTRIRPAQVKAVLSVNRELIQLYWSIGRDIANKQNIFTRPPNKNYHKGSLIYADHRSE